MAPVSSRVVVVGVKECEMDANEGRFKLRDLLSVPMQRVLKYHLLLKVRFVSHC